MLDDNITQAVLIYNSQDLGSVTGAWDKSKGKNNKLASSNVKKVLDYEQAGLIQIIEAKEGKLTKRDYYEENKQRIKNMILNRLNVLETPTGVKFIDRLRGKSSKEELTKTIEIYIENMCSNASMKDLKDIQRQFLSLSSTEEAESLINFVKNAKNYNDKFNNQRKSANAVEGDPIRLKAPEKGLIPQDWNSDEAITFEEVYEIERGVPYSQYAVERYQETKAEMETVVSAFNKKQDFVNFAQSLREEEISADEKSQKLLEGFSNFYSLSEDGGISQIKKLIDKSNLPIMLDENGFDLSALKTEGAKSNALNSLLKLAAQEKEKDFKEFLGGRSIEDYQKAFETSADNIIGPENGKMLAQAMKNDNMTVIQRFSGNASLIGIGLIVVGGALCIFFPPAGAAAATGGATLAGTTAGAAASAGVAGTIGTIASGTITVGNALALGGMAARSGLGAAELATKNNPTAEEFEELTKDFIIDAGGFIIGVPAGKAGMKAFSKLIDKKLTEVFAREITAGNRMQALKTVFNNPEYLKNFMGAAGAKLGTDFTISYLGDLAMMGVLNSKDDWKSLLKANLTGVLVGMSGDLKNAVKIDTPSRITPETSGKTKPSAAREVSTTNPTSRLNEIDSPARVSANDVPITRQITKPDGKIELELNEEGETRARSAAAEIHKKAATSEKAIVKLMQEVGLGVSGQNMTHRAKSAQSLYDKIKNAICDTKHPSTFEEAVNSIKDAVGTRTELLDFDYKKHPDIVEIYKKDPQKAIRMAAERQSEESVQKVKDVITNSANNPDAKINAVRITNYMGRNGIPYFSEKQVAELQDYAAQFGIDLHIKNKLTKVRPSGYTALQMNFETKDGFVYEWQLRGTKVNKFAECEHVPYDIRENKDVTGGRAFLKPLYGPLEKTVTELSPEQYNKYNEYLTAHYEHLRKLELGFESTPPKLEDYGLKDPKLKAENLEHLHEISDKLKNGEITESEAVLEYFFKTSSPELSKIHPDISARLEELFGLYGGIKDDKILSAIAHITKEMSENPQMSPREIFTKTEAALNIAEIYHAANGHLTPIVRANGINAKSEAEKYMQFLKKYNPSGFEDLIRKPSLIERLKKTDWSADKRADLRSAEKFQHLVEFISHNADNKKLCDYLYKDYYLKKSDLPKEIVKKCLDINGKYGVKIIPSHSWLKEPDKYFNQITTELDAWQKASAGMTKLPPAIDALQIKVQYLEGAIGTTSVQNHDIMMNPTYYDLKSVLRHELTHLNDTKFRTVELPQNWKAYRTITYNDGSSAKVLDAKNCKYADELHRAGLDFFEDIPYAFTNAEEFIAQAAGGDMSKYSPEFKRVLTELGMPEWIFKLDEKSGNSINPTTHEQAASLASRGKKAYAADESFPSIPPGKLRAPNKKFAETDDAFATIVKNRANDFTELSKIKNIDEFIQKGAALILDEMGLSGAPIKIEITDNLNEFSMNEATLRISRNWAGLSKGHTKAQGNRAEILGGIAHEMNHYLQNKEIYLNALLREDEFKYKLNMTEECQNLLLWSLGADDSGSARFPYPMEQSDFYFQKANDYMENFMNYIEPYKIIEVDGKKVYAKDADGNYIINEEAYEKYLKQLVESESLTRGDIVRDEYKKLINRQ